MKIIFLGLLLSCVIINTSSSQDLTLTQSDYFDYFKSGRLLDPIYISNKGYFQFALKLKGKKVKEMDVYHLNDKLEFLKKNHVVIPDDMGWKSGYPLVIDVKNKLFFLKHVVNKNKCAGLQSVELNQETLSFPSANHDLFISQDRISFAPNYDHPDEPFELFRKSRNETSVMFTYRLRDNSGGSDRLHNDRIGLHVFDEHLNKQWGGEFVMPYTEAEMDNLDYFVSDAGNVYILCFVRKGKNHFEILKYSKDSQKPIQYLPTLEEAAISSLALFESPDAQVGICGSYQTKAIVGETGMYIALLSLNSSGVEFITGKGIPFPEETIQIPKLKTGLGWFKHNKYVVRDLWVKDIHFTNNGDWVFLAEQISTQKNHYIEYATGSSAYPTSQLQSSDILIMRLNKKKETSFQLIPKTQISSYKYSGNLGFISYVHQDDIHLLYFDDLRNQDKLNEDHFKQCVFPHNAVPVIATLAPDNNVSLKYFPMWSQLMNNFNLDYSNYEKHFRLMDVAFEKKKSKVVLLQIEP